MLPYTKVVLYYEKKKVIFMILFRISRIKCIITIYDSAHYNLNYFSPDMEKLPYMKNMSPIF